jgi:hypothetical protein
MRTRLSTIALAVAALLGATAAATAPAAAQPAPTFDFTDCPAIPPAADPAQWRCEVLVSQGSVRFGALPELPLTGLRTTFAEGQLDGRFAQVFGALRADPVPVPGGLLGNRNPLLRMDIRLEYAGFADFLSVGDRMGEQHLKLAVRSPLLPRTCTIGSDADPIVFRPVRTGGPDPVTMRDNEFAMPGAYRCGPLTRLLERRLGVPSAAGANDLQLSTVVGLRSYG